MTIIKLMIDVYVEKKLSLDGTKDKTIEQSLDTNTNLKDKSMQMYLKCLETDIFISA